MAKNPKTPERIRVPIGTYPEIKEKMDNFFIETKDYIEKKFGKDSSIHIESPDFEQSDNRITYVVYKDKFVAGVIERRTEFNNLEYSFFKDFSSLK